MNLQKSGIIGIVRNYQEYFHNNHPENNMKIIVFSKVVPRADMSSGERRFTGMLQLLAQDHQVDLCITDFDERFSKTESRPYLEVLEKMGIRVPAYGKNSVRKALKQNKYDLGIFEFYWLAEKYLPCFWHYQPEAVTVVDSVDVHFAREQSQAELKLIPRRKADKTKRRELKVYRAADLVIAVSDQDGKLLVKELDAGKVHIIPNIVPSFSRKRIPRKPVLVFIGSYSWPPNVDAVRWFSEKIWPAVHSARSEARFLIIGSGVPEEVKALEKCPGVEVIGFVPDTAPYLEEAAISIAPLRFGGGMKGKVNEALAHGIPVVTTSFGAQGFNAVNGKEMIIADDPEDFTDAIIRLLDDPELQWEIGHAGQALNNRLCSPEAVSKKIGEMSGKAGQIRSEKRTKPSYCNIFSWKILGAVHRIEEIFYYNVDKYFRK